jgi:MOSC domain-containing protein YiiM
MNKGEVIGLFISSKEIGSKKNRPSLNSIKTDKKGVKNDKFYGQDVERSILITSLKSYDILKEKMIDVNIGDLGENIAVDIDIYDLQRGAKIKIGEALLEITQNGTLCNHLSCIDKRVPKLLRNSRGIFAKALNEATVNLGDSVTVLEKEN